MSLEIDSLQTEITNKYSERILIIAPPRTSSTALARCLSQHPNIAYYVHEPFEQVFFEGQEPIVAYNNLLAPIDLKQFGSPTHTTATGIVIKEMPYQVGELFPELAKLATAPIVFNIRDPRLSIMSRITKRKEMRGETNFPLQETGWEDLMNQILTCEQKSIPFCVIDSTDFRTQPLQVIYKLAELGLPCSEDQIHWQAAPGMPLDNLNGRHALLYRRVLQSNGIQPPTERIPNIREFSEHFHDHIKWALAQYNHLKEHPKFINIY